jgi:hypothetical protein
MDPASFNKCAIYFLLRIFKDERAFIDPDTLKVYPIIDSHIEHIAKRCPEGEEVYQSKIKNDAALKTKFLTADSTQKAIRKYYLTYITPVGPMPSPPEWQNLTPNATPNFMKNMNKNTNTNKSRKGRKNRRNRKSRKSRKN